MLAARLHAPRDLRVESAPDPGSPGRGEAIIRVSATGICGSDLHSYKNAKIGDTVVESPLILGHEFAGVVAAVGPESENGLFEPLRSGTRVAVDPAQPCGRCELCERGHPNLCRRLHFCGLWPDSGSLAEYIKMPARSCFPLPDDVDDETGALLEPLGIAIHGVDLGKVRVGTSVAVLGAGPIGQSILQVARLSGAEPVYVIDKFPWRLELARRFGGIPINCDQEDPVEAVRKATGGFGVDVAIEAAWADHSVQQAGDLTRLGGRVVLVGIPDEDRLELVPSGLRRKGLTVLFSRRMKHTYGRALKLVRSGRLDLKTFITHRFPLEDTTRAFAMNVDYRDNVVKIVIGPRGTGSR
ncbi:alcohol dehydrogenase catalytic domain-containing protein [bacterium]|nr:alcohol dehydrogenase catalytic domain-containing protein [bacterium]